MGEVPQVTATLGFCKENCPGVQISTMNEWLGLLTSWVLPAIALLLTCSTGWKKRGDVKDKKDKKDKKDIDEKVPQKKTTWWFKRLDSITDYVLALRFLPYQLQEFMAILGDPVSAIRGAFSEMALDVRVVHDIRPQWGFDTLVKALAMVAGQTKFDEHVDVELTDLILWNGLLVAIDSFMELDNMADLKKALVERKEQLLEPKSHRYEVIREMRLTLTEGKEDNLQKCLQALQRSLGRDSKLQDAISKVLEQRFAKTDSEKGDSKKGDSEKRLVTIKEKLEQCEWASGLKTGIQTTLKSRVDFMKGIVLPVILGLVATAGSFYSAYTQIGDNDTAHALAYGVWYSWAIVIAVVSNCYVATTNPGVAKLALKYDFLSDVTVPLRDRSDNTQKWMKWLKDIGCVKGDAPGSAPSDKGSSRSKAWSSLKLLFEQTLAWICIAMPCACAASISYTTPTVGLGCRSFTFLLYGICTLILSWLPVYRSQIDKTDDTWSQRVFLRASYIFGVCVNVFIIFGGTAFDLIGLYRTCRCEVLFASNDFLLQMSSNTALDVANAKKFWLPVGYMDFGFIWIVCAIAVTCRSYIAYSINPLLETLET